MSDRTTRGVRVQVAPLYHPEHSDPARQRWFFSYTITVSNHSDDVVQLLSRHWIITDGLGKVEHVQGPGVVGETPTLNPGEAFRYTSFCPLPTPFGSMHGTFQMRTDDDVAFDVIIDPFMLEDPASVN